MKNRDSRSLVKSGSSLTLESLESRVLLNGSTYQPHFDSIERFEIGDDVSGIMIKDLDYASDGGIVLSGQGFYGGVDYFVFVTKIKEDLSGVEWTVDLGSRHLGDIEIDSSDNIWVSAGGDPVVLSSDGSIISEIDLVDNLYSNPTNKGHYWTANSGGLTPTSDGGAYAFTRISEWEYSAEYPDYPINQQSLYGISYISSDNKMEIVARYEDYDSYYDYYSYSDTAKIPSATEIYFPLTYQVDDGIYTFDASGELELISTIDYSVSNAEVGSNGDYFAVGYSTDNNYRNTGYIQKYDEGSLVWTRNITDATVTAVNISSDGTIYVFGLASTYADYEEVNPIESNYSKSLSYHVTAYNSGGSLLWSSCLPVPNDYDYSDEFCVEAIATSATGDVALAAVGQGDLDEANWVYDSYISLYTISSDALEGPTGELAANYDEVGYAYTDELNENGYLDLILNGADKKTVTGDELELSGSGAESVTVSGKPKLIDSSTNTYRYTLSGEFSDGPVSVTIPSGSFENTNGVANAETVSVFASFPNLKLLDISIEPDDFTWDSSDNRFEYSGTVSIGPDASLTGGVFKPELTVEGSLNIDSEKLSAEGVVTTSVTGSSQGLMNGSFEILINQDTTYYVQDTDASVSSELTIAGQYLRYSSMKIGVSNGAAKLDLQGDIKLPTEFGSNAITLSGGQYLSLTASGKSLNGATMTFDDVEIDLPYLNLTAEQLSVEYVAAAGTQPEALRFRGKVVLPEVFDATAEFITDTYAGTDGYIEVSASDIKWYGKLSIGEIVIVKDQWVIKEASLEVRDVAGVGMSVQGDGIFTVPPGMDIICGLGFVNEELNYVKLGVDGIELPIGTTGAFLQSINGYVNNIADKDATKIQFGGGLGFSAGKKIEISLPDWAGGDLEGALAEFAVDGGFTFEQLTGSGTVKVVGGLVEGAANATLNWEKGTLTSACTATALNNLLTINGTMKADSKMNLNMIGTGSVAIPSIIPIWGGQNIGNGTTVFKFTNDDDYSNDYAAGWGTTSITAFGKKYDFTIGIKVNLDGSYSFLGGKEAAQAQAGAKSSLTKAYNSKAINTVSTVYTAEEDADWLLINASWDSGSVAEILLTAPDGTVYDEVAIDASDFIMVVDDLSSNGSKVLLIDSPDAGSWTLTVQSNDDLGNVDFNGYEPAEGSEVAIDSAVVNAYTSKVSIQYTGGSEVSFYYDTDGEGNDGILIGTELADGSYSWDTSSVAAGTYYIYATTAGEGDVPYVSYYAEPVVIESSLPTTEVAIGTGGASKVQYVDSDGTVVSIAVKSAAATLSFVGDNIVVDGSKSVIVSGDNLLLNEMYVTESSAASSIAISAKGGSDNSVDIGDIISGSLKSISGKGVNLIGNIGVAGSLASLSWGDISDNSEVIVAEAGSGCTVKAGNIGENVEISILDTVKSVAVLSFGSGEVNSLELGKFSVKEGDVDVDVLTTTGGIGGIAVSGDLSGEILSTGPVKAVASKSGTISSYIISYEGIGKVSAYAFDHAAIYGTSVGSVSCKGEMGTSVIFTTEGDLGAVKAGGDIDLIASINGTIKSISTKGDISGRIDAVNEISKISANNMSGAKVCCLNNIGAISLAGDMIDSWILSGYSLGDDTRPGSDDVFGSGDIKSVSVKGVYSGSVISAGKLPDISALTDIGNIDLPYELNGSIGSIKFGSVAYDADSVFGIFAADGIKSAKDGNANAETNGNFIVG